ncbi:hypothetical protein PAAL109150_02030 [Paenibacillus alkaliterrae]
MLAKQVCCANLAYAYEAGLRSKPKEEEKVEYEICNWR